MNFFGAQFLQTLIALWVIHHACELLAVHLGTDQRRVFLIHGRGISVRIVAAQRIHGL